MSFRRIFPFAWHNSAYSAGGLWFGFVGASVCVGSVELRLRAIIMCIRLDMLDTLMLMMYSGMMRFSTGQD